MVGGKKCSVNSHELLKCALMKSSQVTFICIEIFTVMSSSSLVHFS